MKTNYKSQKQQSRNRNRINNSKKLQKLKLYKKTPKTKKLGNNLTKKTIKKKIKQIKQNQIGGTFRTLPNGDILSRQFLSFTADNSVYEVTPYPLNGMVLQDLCNRNAINIDNGNVSFTNEAPCLVVKKKRITSSSGSKILPEDNKFVTVYEGPDVTKASINGNKLSIPVKKALDDSSNLDITYNISYALQLLASINNPRTSSSNDLQHSRFNIEVDIKDEEGNDIKIIGYPDPKHMTPLLSNTTFMKNFERLASVQKENYLEWLIKLFNYCEMTDPITKELAKDCKKPPSKSPLDDANGIIGSLEESYKLIMTTLITLRQYLSYFVKDTVEQDKIIKGYLEKLKEVMLRDKIFERPNFRIKYQFLLFKRGEDGKYDFLIKNIRELSWQHTSLLEEVLILIQSEIPKRFGLLLPGEKIYENFYSYTELGKLFSIVTEFLHPTTRLETFGYLYKQRITLEELIYSSRLTINREDEKVSFWSMNKIEYPIKKFNISKLSVESNQNQEAQSLLDEMNDSCLEQLELSGGYQHGGAKIKRTINLRGATIIICNLLSSFTVRIVYLDTGGNFWNLVLQANIEHIYENPKIKTSLLKMREFVFSSELEEMMLYKAGGMVDVYEVIEHSQILTNFFKNYSTNFALNFPVIRQKKNYDYVYQEETPLPLQELFNKALDLLKPGKNPQTIVVENDKGPNFTVLTNSEKEQGNNDEYYVFQIRNFIVLEIHHSTENSSTLWIFDNTSPKPTKRLKDIFNLDNHEILPLLLTALKQLQRFNPKTHAIYVNTIANVDINQLHIKVVPHNNYYESLLCKNEISQTTELRSLSINNVISSMDLKNDYYQGFLNDQPNGLVLYVSYLLQFIPPPEI